jgi:hypothetical protein
MFVLFLIFRSGMAIRCGILPSWQESPPHH